jgi:predicted HAD superfamily hydrolase
MKAILKSIIRQTEQFKAGYLLRYKLSIKREFDFINQKYEINTCVEQYAEERGIKNIYRDRQHYLRAKEIQAILFDFHWNRIEARIEKEMIQAEKNFLAKQMKLAERLEKNGFTEDAKVVVLSQTPNLEGYVQEKTLRANFYTIVAEGPIQRPHFRFLVK